MPRTAHVRPSARSSARVIDRFAVRVFACVVGGGVVPIGAASAQSVAVAGGNATAHLAANGATVVDIAVPNAAGISHNRYDAYNVDAAGLVLNNALPGQATRPSELAGTLAGNPQLHRAANLVLNEVVSANRSLLAGITEVHGDRADVVVANPNGITCADCGFLNTDRVTLTTGTPHLDAVGALAGFDVLGGDVLFEAGKGGTRHPSGLATLDVVARNVKVDSPVQARDLSLIAGPNRFDYRTRQITGQNSPTDRPPRIFAIDGTDVGAMYGERVRLIATEQGAGVRTVGFVGQWDADVTIQSNSDVVHMGILMGRQLDLSSDEMMRVEGAAAASDTLRMRAQGIVIDRRASVRAGDMDIRAIGSQQPGRSRFGDGMFLNLGSVEARGRIDVAADRGLYSAGRLHARGDTRMRAPWVLGDRARMGVLYVNGAPIPRAPNQ